VRRLIWADECAGPAGSPPDPARWGVRLTDEWQPRDELQAYTDDPANAHYDGRGHLVLTAIRDSGRGRPGYTSARLSARHAATPWTFHFGRIAARIKVPTSIGVWPAWWLLGPDDRYGWPACGEVDIMEAPSSAGTAGQVHQGTHSPAPGGGEVSVGVTPSCGAWGADFHVYGVDWTPGRIAFFIDERWTGVVTRADVEARGGLWRFDDLPQSLILNVAVGGWARVPDPSWSRQEMLVDWVRVYDRIYDRER